MKRNQTERSFNLESPNPNPNFPRTWDQNSNPFTSLPFDLWPFVPALLNLLSILWHHHHHPPQNPKLQQSKLIKQKPKTKKKRKKQERMSPPSTLSKNLPLLIATMALAYVTNPDDGSFRKYIEVCIYKLEFNLSFIFCFFLWVLALGFEFWVLSGLLTGIELGLAYPSYWVTDPFLSCFILFHVI